MKNIYRDLWIRVGGSVIAAHYIDALGRPESFFHRLTYYYYYIDLLFGSLIAFSVWSFVRYLIIQLDKRFSWFEHTTTRLLIQLILCLLLPLVGSFLLTYLFLHLVWEQNIFQSEYLYNELPVVALILLLLNLGYFTWWLYRQMPQASKVEAPQTERLYEPTVPAPPIVTERKSGFIEVPKAGRTVLLKVSDLAYAYLKDGYCYLRSHSGETYVTTYALDDLYDLLDMEQFFRANRQMIINRKACTAYSSIEFGKIGLELEPVFKEPVVVSQKRARAFREWISVTI